MEVSVYIYEDNKTEILASVEKIIKEESGCESIDWSNDKNSFKTNIATNCSKMKIAFEKIIELYPDVSLYGTDTYDVREDDSSADWWGTDSVYSAREKGKVVIKESSETGWN